MELKEYMDLVIALEAAKALILMLEAENRELREKAAPINHFQLLRES